MANRIKASVRTRAGALIAVAAVSLGALAMASAGTVSATPRADTRKPKVTITDMEVEAYNPVTIRGTASDKVGVKKVRIRLQRADNNKYYNGATWQTKPVWLTTKLGKPGATSTSWKAGFTLPKVFMFLEAQSIDTSGNASLIARSQFRVNAPPDLSVVALATNPEVLVQGTNAYAVVSTLNSGGAEYKKAFRLDVTVPEALTLTSTTASNGWTCTVTDHAARCRFTEGVPSGGNSPSIAFNFTVAEDAPSPVTITAALTAPLQLRPSNDSMSIDVEVVSPERRERGR